MSQLASILIHQAKQNHETTLDLGNCSLTELPYELFELVWLETLILSNSWSEYNFDNQKWELCFSQNKGDFNTILNNIKHLSPKLASLKKLKNLIVNKQDLSNISSLKDLTQLQVLDISSTQVSDLSSLKGLTQLQILRINQTQVSDLTPLEDLTLLQILLIYCTPVSDLKPLAHLTS